MTAVNTERYIGCGLCAMGCPNGAVELKRKRENKIVNPPRDFATREHERMHKRGLSR
ncbi:MAG: hypothetical protein ABR962_02340 [Candidatus Bathyarchaeia archaeon]